MKPNFALSLSHEGIGLFSRAKRGWRQIGEASLEAQDLSETLGYLRDKATRLTGNGLSCKLILPNSQILYTTVNAPGPGEAERVAQIRQALSGLTPYESSDLAFDWRTNGDTVQIAAVARQTLIEAETFAVDHRFNPVSFVSIPEKGKFEWEPFFGTTEFSKSFLNFGDQVEADTEPFTTVVSAEHTQNPTFAHSYSDAAPVEADHEPELDPIPEMAELVGKPEAQTQNEQEALAGLEEVVAAKDGSAQSGAKENTRAKAAETEPEDEPSTDEVSSEQTVQEQSDEDAVVIPKHLSEAKGKTSVPASLTAPLAPLTEENDSSTEFVHRPIAVGKPPSDLAARLSGVKRPEAPTKKGAFTSRWRKKSSENDQKYATDPSLTSGGPKDDNLSNPTPIISETASATNASELSPEERLAGANVTSAALDFPDADGLADSLTQDTNQVRKPANTAATTKSQFQAPPSVDEKNTQPKLSHNYLMWLVVLFVLVAVTVLWILANKTSETTLIAPPEMGFEAEQSTQITGVSATEIAPIAPTIPAETPNTPIVTAALDIASAMSENLKTLRPQNTRILDIFDPEPSAPLPLDFLQAIEAYDTSGIWQKSPKFSSPPDIQTTDALYFPSLDPEVEISDAIALPAALPEPEDTPLEIQTLPAPAGKVFDLGDDGLVTASPEGTLNPDGILIFSGPPQKRSAPRPNTSEGESAASDARTALANKRPTARPDNLTELHERGLYGGRTKSQLAKIRPAPRPLSEQIVAQTSSSGIALSTSATKLAVKTSRHPPAKPKDFASLVEKTRSKTTFAVTAAKPETLKSPIAKIRSSSAPQIPTRASVAAEATQKNVLSMKKTSLIGVYGTAANRSALVRMRNGKIVKISVGDRVNGGKVAAIGATQVHYVKGGKNYLLRMPPHG